jgi:phage shock protein PspC (stress-responsive transcriptional regulator)
MVPAVGEADHEVMPTTTAPPPPPPVDPTIPDPDPTPPPFDVRPPFRRSTTDRRFGGVAGGLARYFDVDDTLVRVGLVVAAIASAGLVLAAYAAVWLFVPDDHETEPYGLAWYQRHGDRAAGTLAIVFVGLLAFAALRMVLGFTFGWHDHSPDLLVLLGLAGIVVASRTDPESRPGRRRHRRHQPDDMPAADEDPTAVADRTMVAPVVVDPEVQRKRALGHRIRATSILSALVAGAAATLLWATGATSIGGWVIPAVVLVCLGAGLALAPWSGWSWALVFAALVTVAALAVSLVPGVSLRGGIGERSARPVTVADAERGAHRVGIGRTELDLTGLDPKPGSTVHVHASVGVGVVQIDVRPDVAVRLRGHLSGGTVRVDGREPGIDGTDLHLDRTFPPITTATTAGGHDARTPAVVVVDVHAGFGAIQIDRFTKPHFGR